MTPESILDDKDRLPLGEYNGDQVFVVVSVLETENRIQAICPTHKKMWFLRVGDTNIFECPHVDHTGGIVGGRDPGRDNLVDS